jgi:hypothetical protein
VVYLQFFPLVSSFPSSSFSNDCLFWYVFHIHDIRRQQSLFVLHSSFGRTSSFAINIHQSQSAFDKAVTESSLIHSTYNNHNNTNHKDGANSKPAGGRMRTTINHDDNHNNNHQNLNPTDATQEFVSRLFHLPFGKGSSQSEQDENTIHCAF